MNRNRPREYVPIGKMQTPETEEAWRAAKILLGKAATQAGKTEAAKEQAGGNREAELLPSTDKDYFLSSISGENIHHYTHTKKKPGKIISYTSATISLKYQRYGENGGSSWRISMSSSTNYIRRIRWKCRVLL